jgi:hypothetical protein
MVASKSMKPLAPEAAGSEFCGCDGYRQAKADHAVRTGGAARFVK